MTNSSYTGTGFKALTCLLAVVMGYSNYVTGVITAGSKEFYLFEYKDANGNINAGFACFCQKRSDGTSYWLGSGTSSCNTPTTNAKAIPPNSVLIPSAYRLSISTVPAGACCLSLPKDSNGTIPGIPASGSGDGHCFF